jgi:hypothetical protein
VVGDQLIRWMVQNQETVREVYKKPMSPLRKSLSQQTMSGTGLLVMLLLLLLLFYLVLNIPTLLIYQWASYQNP